MWLTVSALCGSLCLAVCAGAFQPPPFPTLPPAACYAATAPSQLTVGGALSGVVAAWPPAARAPRLGWSLPPTVRASAGYQVAVRLAAAGGGGGGAPLWDSGWVAAANATTARYAGPPLQRPFFFAVRAAPDGPWSAPSADFLVGLAGAAGWGPGAAPVWAPPAAPPAAAGGAFGQFVLLRGALPRPPAFARATLFATADPQPSARDRENGKLLAAYRVYVDGALVGLGPGRPGRCGPVCPVGGSPGGPCTCDPEHVYDAYDVTALAQGAGDGPLTVAVAAYQAPMKAGSVADAPGSVQLAIAFDSADGSRTVVGTTAGGGWRALDATAWMNPGCCAAEAWFFQPSENFNASAEPVGWRTAAFNDSAWPLAVPSRPFAAPLVARPTLSMLQVDGLVPARSELLAPGHLFVDLGREIQGGLRLDFGADTPAGSAWAVQLGEELSSPDPNPAVMWQMRTGNVYRDVVTTRAGAQTIEHHEYREFRYAEVIFLPPAVPAGGQCAASALGDYSDAVTLACAEPGATIAAFAFASYGAPAGACAPGAASNNTFVANATCACADTARVLAGLCVGRHNCSLTPDDALFCNGADPCHLVPKRLAAAWHCSVDPPPPPPGPPPTPPSPPAVTAWQIVYPAAYIDEAARRCPGGAAGLEQSAAPGCAAAREPAACARAAAALAARGLLPAAPGAVAQFSSSEPDLDAVFAFALYTVQVTGLDVFTDSNTRQRSVICAEALLATNLNQLAASYEGALQLYTTNYHANTNGGGFGWAEWPQLLLRSVLELWRGLGGEADDLPSAGAGGSALGLFAAQYAEMRNFTEQSLINVTGSGLWTCPATTPAPFQCSQPEVDWPPAARDGFVMTPTNTVVNSHTVAGLEHFAALADAVGQAADAAAARAAAASLRGAMNAALWDSEQAAYVDGATTRHAAIHSTVYPVANAVPDAATAAAAWPTLVASLVGGVPVGPYPALFLADALFGNASDHGVAGVHGFILNNASHSWLAQLRAGATTTMEAWTVEEKPNLTWSHPWMALVLQAIIKYVVGATPTSPGWETFLVRPQPGRVLSGSAAVPTPRGPVGVAWAQTWSAAAAAPTAFSLRVALPGAVSARLCVPLPPCGAGAAILLDGTAVVGVIDGDYVCIDGVGAGEHVAACPAALGGAGALNE